MQFVSFDWFPLVKIVRALTSDRVGKLADESSDDKYERGGGYSDNGPSASNSEASGSSSYSSEASNEHSKRAKLRMTRKYVEDYTALTICRTIESADIFHPIDQLSFLC